MSSLEENKLSISSEADFGCFKLKQQNLEKETKAKLNNFINQVENYWTELIPALFSNDKFKDILKSQESCTREWLEFVVDNWIQPKTNKFRSRAILSMLTYSCIKPDATDHEQHLSTVLGVVLELTAASRRLATLVVENNLGLNNVTDKHSGKIIGCYTQNLQTLAMDDIFLLNSMAMRIAFQEFSKEKCFKIFRHLLSYRNSKNALGLAYTHNCKQHNIEMFTLSIYLEVIKFKSNDIFVDPIILALVIAEVEGKAIYDAVEIFGTKLGLLFQMQFEYAALFEVKSKDEHVSIENNSIKSLKTMPTWFEIKAFQLAKTDKQKAIFIDTCNMNTVASQESYHELFTELGVIDAYYEYKQELLTEIEQIINTLDNSIPKEPFLYALELVLNNTNVDNILIQNMF